MWPGDVKSIMMYIVMTSAVNACGSRSGSDCNDVNVKTKGNNNNGDQSGNNGNKVDLPPESAAPPPAHRKRCCPYDFDSRICKVVNDRYLCGFNKNVGRPESNDRAVELSDGCRLRNGRLECGYVEGPFNNPRRPPVFYNYDYITDGNVHKINENDDDYLNNDNDIQRLKVKEDGNKVINRPKQRCVEINDRIICRDA
nr:uncharacterized protein LOC128677672 [Plodia interpunctella]